MSKCKINQVIIIFLYMFIGAWLITVCDFTSKYVLEYIILLLSYFIVAGMLMVLAIYKNGDIFEPIFLTLILLVGLFSVAPICLTAKGVDTLFGKAFMGGCIKTTFIYILSSIALCLGYYQKEWKRCENNTLTHLENEIVNKKDVLIVMYAIWMFGFVVGMWYELHSLGRSPLYILTLGSNGSNNSTAATVSSVNFLLNFSYSCILPWLYIMFLSKKILPKIITTYCMLMLYIVCGWRNVIIIVALAFVVVYFVNKNKRPSKGMIIISIVCGVLFLGLLGAMRHGLRNGYRTEVNLFDMKSILFALESNFNLYQPFYAIVENYPSKHFYTLGEGMIFNTLITFIPRAIWHGKPLARDFALLEAIRISTSDSVIDGAAMAVPSIAEFYVDFGIIGTVILSFIAGKILQNCTKWYKSVNRDFSSIALYGIVFGALDVLVMRGYMPNNFYYMIFLTWPHFVARYMIKKGKKYGKSETAEN